MDFESEWLITTFRYNVSYEFRAKRFTVGLEWARKSLQKFELTSESDKMWLLKRAESPL